MTSANSLFRFLVQSVGLGLVVAAVVILLMPYISNQSAGGLQQREGEVLSFNKAVGRAAPAVVNIYSLGDSEGSYYEPKTSRVWRLGSGVIMTPRGYILTAQHVVDDVDGILVALQDGRRYAAQLVGSDDYTDLAVLKIDADNLPVIPLPNERPARVGDIVLAIGNPYNIGQTITQGIVSASGGRVAVSRSSYTDLIQMDAVINQGASGGALVNSSGQLVGINNARFTTAFGDGGAEGIYFAVPYSTASSIMQTLISEGKVVRGWIGISVNPNVAQQGQPGLQVTQVEAGSPAAVAGIKLGDVITRIGGTPVNAPAEGMQQVVDSAPGTELPVEVLRDGQRLELMVTTAETPEL